MAIGVEHLGGQVECPHCKSVVQTPAPAKTDAAPAPNPDPTWPESLFSAQGASEAVIGAEDMPKVQMPGPPRVEEPTEAQGEDEPLPKFKPRVIHDRSMIPLIMLIFLVPYAFFTTLFILYLLFFAPARSDPLEYLRDPAANPGKGGPKRGELLRPKHDQPLAAHLHTSLGSPIKAGDLLITPQRVRLTPLGDLQLVLHATNKSPDATFAPIHPLFVQLDFKNVDIKPYSFVESIAVPKSIENIYGLDPSYHLDAEAKDEGVANGTLKPGAGITIALTTYERYRNSHVRAITKGSDPYLWRVQVRRGFVKVDGKDVSATMVIGVEFSAGDIEAKKS